MKSFPHVPGYEPCPNSAPDSLTPRKVSFPVEAGGAELVVLVAGLVVVEVVVGLDVVEVVMVVAPG
jgi:hypothetical protein